MINTPIQLAAGTTATCGPFWRRRRDSFTLIEILVSMAILSIIVLALGSLMSLITQTWLAGINAGNNFAKARTMLTVLDRDTQTMVLRRDLAAFSDATGNTNLCFYSAIQGQPPALGTVDDRELSLVQYYLQQLPAPGSATNSLLLRYNWGMNFQAGGTTPSVSAITNASSTNSDNIMAQMASPTWAGLPPEDVANGVIAFRWQFVDGMGGLITPPYISAGISSGAKTPFYYNFTTPSASYNPRSLVVSLVVVSDNAYQLAVQTGTLGTLITQFSSATMPTTGGGAGSTTYDTETYAQLWSGVLNNPAGFAKSQGIPAPVIATGTIQVFERHIPFPVTTP
jgi:prepilin-type N-terminal cleavage/methylation domain-containing protein